MRVLSSAMERLSSVGFKRVHVVLACDNQTMLDEVHSRLKRYTNISVKFDQSERRSAVMNTAFLAVLRPTMNITEYAMDSISIVSALRLSDVLVACGGSHVARLAMELAFFGGQLKIPPVSLDVPWYVNP